VIHWKNFNRPARFTFAVGLPRIRGWTYTYDAQNRLTTVKQGTTTMAQYWYDGLNRQITRNVNGAITFHVWDGWNLIEERGTRNAIQNIYLYAGDQIIENVTTKRFYFQDSLGNTSHLSDEAGNLLERYTYSAFGMPSFYNAAGTLISASTKGTRHLFQGQLWTQETGLNDYRNRVEHPTMGVFLQPDPIGFKGDAANLYRFCGNNAVNQTDPMGLFNPNAGAGLTSWANGGWFADGGMVDNQTLKMAYDDATRTAAGPNGGGGGAKSLSKKDEGKKSSTSREYSDWREAADGQREETMNRVKSAGVEYGGELARNDRNSNAFIATSPHRGLGVKKIDDGIQKGYHQAFSPDRSRVPRGYTMTGFYYGYVHHDPKFFRYDAIRSQAMRLDAVLFLPPRPGAHNKINTSLYYDHNTEPPQ
jgi:RHS repeat-associated protein